MNRGTPVRIVMPDVDRLHGAEGMISAVKQGPDGTPYYLVRCKAAASGYVRCLPEEVEAQVSFSSLNGYSGDICVKCQGIRMVRIGSCMRCEDCGETTGCG